MIRNVLMGLILSAALTGSAQAAIVVYNFTLTPGQEVTVPTLGGATPLGTATVTLDTVGQTVAVSGSYSGLTSSVTGSHIHGLAGPGVNAAPFVTLSHTGGTSGTFSVAATAISAAQVTGMLDGLTYINVHTVDNSGGEIRGQIVPEPATALFLAIGGAALALKRRQA